MQREEMPEDLVRAEETRFLLRSPGFVAFLSALIMGLGQLFNGQFKKAIVFFLAQVGIFLYLWDFMGPRVVADTLITFVPSIVYTIALIALVIFGVLLWMFNIRDAYQVAQFLSFIFDRTNPNLEGDEEEFIQSTLSVTRMGLRVHRGMTRKALFIGMAVAMYSAALIAVGARLAGNNEEVHLRLQLKAQPQDVLLHLRLGETMLARGETKASKREFETGLAIAKAAKDTQNTYRAYTDLARVETEYGASANANAMLKEALALYAPQMPAGMDPEALQAPGTEASASPAGTLANAVEIPAAGGTLPQKILAFRTKALAVDPNSVDPDAVDTPPSPHVSPAASARPVPPPVETPEPAQTRAESPAPRVVPEASVVESGLPPQTNLDRALSNLKVKNYAEARRLLAAYARRGEKNGDYYAILGRLQAATGDWSDAVVSLTSAAGRSVHSSAAGSDLELLLAEALTRTGQAPAAAKHLEGYLRKHPGEPRAVLRLSEVYRTTGRLQAARHLVEEALIENPDHTDLLLADFRIAAQTKSVETAYQVAMKIIKSGQKDYDLVRGMVEQALDATQGQLAQRVANAVIQHDDSEGTGYILMGAIYARQDDARRAMQYFDKASELGSQEPDLFYEIGVLYRRLGKNKRAIEALQRACDLNPRSALYARELAGLSLKAGEFERARVAYLKALRSTPEDVVARLGLGESYVRLGKTALARDTFQELLSTDPNNARAKEWLALIDASRRSSPRLAQADAGRINSEVGERTVGEEEPEPAPKKKEAEEETAEERGPETYVDPRRRASTPASPVPSARDAEPAAGEPEPAREVEPARRAPEAAAQVPAGGLEEAERAYHAGDLATAERLYRQELAQHPQSFRSHYRLAMIHRTRKEYGQAIVELECSRALSPKDPGVLLELGQLYTEQKLANRAILRLEELLRSDPKNLAGRYTLGVNYERSRQYAKAEEQYKKIARDYPQFVDAHDYLGNLYFSQRHFHEAGEEYARVVRANPRDVKTRFKLAVALYREERPDAAKQEFATLARSLSAGDPLLPKVQQYLGKL